MQFHFDRLLSLGGWVEFSGVERSLGSNRSSVNLTAEEPEGGGTGGESDMSDHRVNEPSTANDPAALRHKYPPDLYRASVQRTITVREVCAKRGATVSLGNQSSSWLCERIESRQTRAGVLIRREFFIKYSRPIRMVFCAFCG